MATLAEARAKWVTDTAKPVTMSQADYDALADSMAQPMLDDLNRREAAAAGALLRQQFIDGIEALRSDLAVVQTAIGTSTPLTAAQIRVGFRDVLTSLIWLGDRIANGTIPTRDG